MQNSNLTDSAIDIISTISKALREAKRWHGCAYCNSFNTSFTKVEIEENIISVNVNCSDCKNDDSLLYLLKN